MYSDDFLSICIHANIHTGSFIFITADMSWEGQGVHCPEGDLVFMSDDGGGGTLSCAWVTWGMSLCGHLGVLGDLGTSSTWQHKGH